MRLVGNVALAAVFVHIALQSGTDTDPRINALELVLCGALAVCKSYLYYFRTFIFVLSITSFTEIFR